MDGLLLDLEHDGTRRRDPKDGKEKAHLVNREQRLRALIDDQGGWRVEDRLDASVYATLSLEDATGSFGKAEVGDDLVEHRAAAVSQMCSTREPASSTSCWERQRLGHCLHAGVV